MNTVLNEGALENNRSGRLTPSQMLSFIPMILMGGFFTNGRRLCICDDLRPVPTDFHGRRSYVYHYIWRPFPGFTLGRVSGCRQANH